MMNDVFRGGEMLPLIDEFYSIQGEGYNFGEAAYFIRVGGCDIGCRWCDTKISWKYDSNKLVSVANIVKNVINTKAKTIVVTGGEPSNYNLDILCKEARRYGIKTFLETAGANKINGEWDWICLSPKKLSPPLQENLDIANEIKVIIFDKSDFTWAEMNSKKISAKCKMYLQPEWSQNKKVTHDIVNYIKSNPKWKLSIQAHKYINIP